jgi:hypothetical protein
VFTSVRIFLDLNNDQMNAVTEYLKSIALDIAAKSRDENNSLLPDKHLIAEANTVKKKAINCLLSIDNFPQREIFYFDTLTKLVDICDILFNSGNSVSADVSVLLDLLTEIKKVIPSEISPKLQLPKAFIVLQSESMDESCKVHVEILKEQGIDPKLITIAAIPFKQFAHPVHKLYWRNFTWLKGYKEKLETIDWENADCNSKTEALISLLLNCDFNDDRFFVYCRKYILKRTSQYGTKRKRLAEFAECEKLILQDTLDEFPAHNHRRPNISKKLIDWIRIETNAINANDSFDDDLYKIEYLWDVDTIALYHKYLMDHGITKKINTELYARQIAATISSIGKEEFKWETIHKRLYGKDQKSLKRIFDPLLAVVEDIRNFLRK